MQIPVVDLFAGPGGLGEGFSAYKDISSNDGFELVLSIEADKYAHQTLILRSFYREFNENVPIEYYKYLEGLLSLEELFRGYPVQARNALQKSWHAVLGKEDIREIDRRIKHSINDKKFWVLIGGPPCQPYSIVGRSRLGGINDNDKRLYLYREYYRILAFHSPPIFVMENVRGILSAKIQNTAIFSQILDDLKDPSSAYSKRNKNTNIKLNCPGYRIYSLIKPPQFHNHGAPVYKPDDYLIKAENYGIPQSRHRVILLGIRSDIEIFDTNILQRKELIPLKKVLSGLPEIRSGLSRINDTYENWLKALKQVIDNRIINNINKKQAILLREIIEKLGHRSLNTGSEYIKSSSIGIDYEHEWFLDKNLKGICNHSSKSHMIEDLHRYLYLTSYAEIFGISPKLQEFPSELLPQHKNIKETKGKNIFNDRFRVHTQERPSKTITSHISKDGHYYVHPDPAQCRSFTVREAARIQTFPDNYYFCGPKTQQYVQVGNAVPPLLARQIADIVMNLIHKMAWNQNDMTENEIQIPKPRV